MDDHTTHGAARDRLRSVSEVAGLAGVTVRTLHHYDDLGLLVPARRSEAGYRLYARADLERLQEILFFRELGMPLDEVARVLDAPEYDRATALRAQLARVTDESDRLRRVAKAIDAALAAHEEGRTMSDDAMFEVFADSGLTREEHEARQAEVEQRWGDTDAYEQTARRTATYGRAEWQAIKDEQEATNQRFAALLADGSPADGAAAMAAAEEHRLAIERWFYDCPHDMHRGLGEMYVADDRFAENYGRVAEGLAAYIRDAIVANADRHAAG